jgi:hypothetical protein
MHDGRMSKQTLLAFAPFVLAVACGPQTEPPNPLAAPAIEALAAASNAGDVAPLLTEDALVIDGADRFTGKVAAAAALNGASLTVKSAVDSHHDVLRALVTRGDDELLLFGRLDDEGLLSFVVLTAQPGEGDGQGGDVVNAYQAAWNEGDVAKRTAQLEESWADDGRYVDPTADVSGRDALVEHITGFRDGLPGAAVLGTSDAVEGAGMVHFRWVTTGLAGAVNIEGMDVGLTDDDGKLTLIAGFFGALAPL